MKENRGLMTSGNIYAKIALFAVPLLLGNFFQLMYNTIDSIIVGNYVGATALAAVGASTPIINLLIGFFQGLATGAGVVVSRFFGAGRKQELLSHGAFVEVLSPDWFRDEIRCDIAEMASHYGLTTTDPTGDKDTLSE